MAKGKKTGGRQKGSLNKRNLVAMEIAEKMAMDPLEVLMMFAAGDWEGLGYDNSVYHMERPDGSIKMGYVISPELRMNAAKEAAQYIYAKKKQEEPRDDDSRDVTSLEDKQKLLEKAEIEIAILKEQIASESSN